MGGLFRSSGGSKKPKPVAEATPAAPTPAATAARESAEMDAATRRASRRGATRGLLSEARLGGEQATLGSVVQ